MKERIWYEVIALDGYGGIDITVYIRGKNLANILSICEDVPGLVKPREGVLSRRRVPFVQIPNIKKIENPIILSTLNKIPQTTYYIFKSELEKEIEAVV